MGGDVNWGHRRPVRKEPDRMPSSFAQLIAAWGIPVGYIVMCIIANRVNAMRAERVPDDLAPTSTVPDIHPALLGALRYRREGDVRRGMNACRVALATLVCLMGRGHVTLEERQGANEEDATGEQDGPISTGRRRGQKRKRYSTDQRTLDFGSGLWIEVRAKDLGRYDREAVDLLMPEGAREASVAELCGRIGSGDTYRPLERFLGQYSNDLLGAGLARSTSVLSQLLFSGPVSVLACFWCLLGPAMANMEPGPVFAPVACVLMIAIMICRGALVDLGPRLTPAGARILGQANANVRWAEGVCCGDIDPGQDLTPENVTRLLSVLLATGNVEDASDLADLLAREGYADDPDAAGAPSAVRLCARRTYMDVDPSSRWHKRSPAWLLVHKAEEPS
ncbi:DUF2207 domain-containing protein [Olsenella sp. SW781]|nr:DUF2207 domain-containing protein [Olsenella sp. SW781]